MKNTVSTGFLAKKPKLKWGLIVFVGLIMVALLLIVNGMWGNPIRKQIAKTRCLRYFQDNYEEKFHIDAVFFSFKFPGYILTLSPEQNPQIKFICNPNCKTLCYSDEYGGILASNLLVRQVSALLTQKYGNLALRINAAEDPGTYYGGEEPDFFERDPLIRLGKNHQNLSITWVDSSISQGEFEQIAKEMAGLIDSQLWEINPNLQVIIAVYPDGTGQSARYSAYSIHFPTYFSEN